MRTGEMSNYSGPEHAISTQRAIGPADVSSAQVKDLQAQLERTTRDFLSVYKLLAGHRDAQVEGLYQVIQHFPLTEYAHTDPNRALSIGDIAARIGHACGEPEDYCKTLRYAAPMCELDQFEANAAIAAVLHMAQEISHNLNEDFDGNGFPRQLRGERIPLSARIALVAHSFYTCMADKPFGLGMSETDSLTMVRKNSGGRYDPVVIESLERALAQKKTGQGLESAATQQGSA